MFDNENQSLAMPKQNGLTTSSDVGAALATRQAQEVQAMVIVAKRFPRDFVEVEKKLIQSCERINLAKIATYEYSRGGSNITGPSIRLAEAAAQAIGNIDCGWLELQRLEDSSICMAYAWDIENNNRVTSTFTVPHYRDKNEKQGAKSVKVKIRLTDDRDIYELCANMASRRKRACILQVVPGDLVDLALSKCEETLKKNLGTVQEQAVKWGKLFEKEYAVSAEIIMKYIGSHPSKWTQNDIFRLQKLYNALQDNMTTVEEAFPDMAAKPITKEQKAELMKLAAGKQDEATKILNGMGYTGINDVKDTDFDAIKAAFGGLQ